MDLEALKTEDISAYELDKTVEVAGELRRELHALRMDIYVDKKVSLGKKRKLKKNLARVLTRKTELNNLKAK